MISPPKYDTCTLSTFQARPAAVLVVILTLCMCSVLVSVYYVHSVSLATPLEVMRANRAALLRDKRVTGDDDDKGGTASSATKKKGIHILHPGSMNASGVEVGALLWFFPCIVYNI